VDDHPSYKQSTIATDRPDQTESPFLVPKGRFQIETGAWIEIDKNDTSRFKNSVYNTTLWKYSISDHFEFRLITEIINEKEYKIKSSGDSLKSKYGGFNSVAIGSKIFICEENGMIPKISLISHIQLPYFGARNFKPSYLAPRFRFLFQHTLSERLAFSYNLGGEWDGDSKNASVIYTASLGISLFENCGMFLEAYGFMTENGNKNDRFSGSFSHDHRLDAGITYIIGKDFQLDASGGIGLSKISPDYFLSCGVSWRFPKVKSN
jgi:hypothetical protein